MEEVVHSLRSRNAQHLLIIPTKHAMLIHYIGYTYCTSATCFFANCTIFRENFCTVCLERHIVVKLLTVVSIIVTL